MCSPTALFAISAGVSALSASSQLIGQRQQAKAQENYQKQLMDERQQQIEENYRRTIEAYNLKSQGELAKLGETEQASRAKEFEVRREALRQQAKSLSAASSMGASGQSLYVGLLDSLAQAGFDISALGVNLGLKERQTERNLKGFQIEARNRAASIQPYSPSPVYSPSGVGAALTIAGSTLGAYNTFLAPGAKADTLTGSQGGGGLTPTGRGSSVTPINRLTT